MSSLRRLAFPLVLVRARLAAGGQRLALVSLGVVGGAAVLAAVLAGRLVMQDRALARATAQLDPGDRVVQVAWFGGYGGNWRALDRMVAPAMRRTLGQEPARAMLFREASVEGRLVNLRAADDLGRWVKLLSGRLPARCVPTHCEVLRLEGKGPIPSTRYLRLIEVGRATLRPDAPFAPFVLPAPQTQEVARAVRYHTPQPSPVVIANGVDGLSRTPELQTFFRSYAWSVPVAGADVHPWSLGAFARRVGRLSDAVLAHGDQFQVTAPTQQLAAEAASSNAAAQRLLLLGGEGGALLLAFTILAAAALRRDVTAARRRLVWFGAHRFQVELHTLGESLALASLGTVVGWVVGGAAAAAIAGSSGSPAGQVVTHALLSGSGIGAALAIAAAAGLLLYATVRAPAVELGRLAVTPVDVAAGGAVAVVLVGWARGSIGTGQLASGGTGAFLLLVPALVVFAAAVAAARLLSPALRALGRAGRGGPVPLRLAAASLARNPGHAAVAATFLVASLGLAFFAVAYRATLERGQRDEAAYAVPASFVLTEDLLQLVPVLHGAPAEDLPPQPIEALRLSGNVPSGAAFTFLGLAAPDLPRTGGWRGDFSSASRAALASRIAPEVDERLRTTALPRGRRFTLPVTARGDDVGVIGVFRSPLGDYQPVPLGHTDGARTVVLHGRVPFRHGTLAQLQLTLLGNLHAAANGGIGLQPSARGVLTLGVPRVDGAPSRRAFTGWVGTGGVGGSAGRVGYLVTPDRTAVYRPAQPTDGRPLPVLVTRALAADAGPHGLLPLQVEGEQITARVVGVLAHFPSIAGDAVVADRQTASTLLDTRSPGLGLTDELWLDVPRASEAAWAARLARPPFTQLAVTSRADALAQLQGDPLARGALLTLTGTAAVALLLALVGVLLSVVADVRDDRGELFDLEAQGASPATIRAHLRLRALLVGAFGIAGGVALGAILSSLVLSLVSVTAGASEPEPPLRLVVDAPLLAAAGGAYVVLAAALVAWSTRLHGVAPVRAAEAAA